MINKKVPLVKFGNVTILNLDHIDYVSINGPYDGKWNFVIAFNDERKLTWAYDDKATAQKNLDLLMSLNEEFIISELP